MVGRHGWKFGWIGVDQWRCKFGHPLDLHVAALEQPHDGMDRTRPAGMWEHVQVYTATRGAAARPVVAIGLDLAKSVFPVRGVDVSAHAILRRRLGRGDLLPFFAKQPSCVIGMEACSSAPTTDAGAERARHEVRLIPPQYVKPYVKRNKTDATDAEAICEAVGRPNMRFVSIRSVEQQSILALHRVRALLVRRRTSAVNAMRGVLSEFGVLPAKGIRRVEKLRQRMSRTEPASLPDEAREAIGVLFDHLDGLRDRVEKVEARILAWHRASEAGQRLASAPGVGPLTATAIGAAVGDGSQPVQVSTPLRRMAGLDASHSSERRNCRPPAPEAISLAAGRSCRG